MTATSDYFTVSIHSQQECGRGTFCEAYLGTRNTSFTILPHGKNAFKLEILRETMHTPYVIWWLGASAALHNGPLGEGQRRERILNSQDILCCGLTNKAVTGFKFTAVPEIADDYVAAAEKTWRCVVRAFTM